MVVAIIQARMGSTRLPGKVLKPLAGKPMLAHVIERARSATRVSGVVLATSNKPEDDPVAALGKSLGVAVFRGSESDVLDRYYQAAKEAKADVVVRITGDCPMHNSEAIDRVVEHFLQNTSDYCLGPTDVPEGLDTEVFTFKALEHSAREAALPSEREHVTLYIRNHPEFFALAPAWSIGGEGNSNIHLSVDTPEDFVFAENIFKELGEMFTERDIIALLERKPHLREINRGSTGFEGLHKSLKEDEEWKVVQRLVLGTVELGLPYGLDQDIPQPNRDEVFAILDAAYEAGIQTFDTAAAYGSAEELLGEWMALRGKGDVKIISKGANRDDIERSLQRLGVRQLDGYLLHNAQGLLKDLEEAKHAGKVLHLGASVYEPGEIKEWFEYVQVPFNALDRRFMGIQNKVVFARSPFLQGLLLRDTNALPANVAHCREFLEQFVAVCKRCSLSQLQGALLFVLHAEPTYRIVFGVKTQSQLREIVAAAKTPLPEGFLDAIRALPMPDATVINPALWNKKSPM